jgi:hypothetical protein
MPIKFVSDKNFNNYILIALNNKAKYKFYAFCLIAACAAERRAIGTRNGEHET